MFVYFDLGNVLLNFDHDLMCRQMADVVQAAGGKSSAADVKELLFSESAGRKSLEWRFERGELAADEFYAEFCEGVQAEPNRAALARAASVIFTANWSVRTLLGALLAARQPMGILSNTNSLHWDYVSRGRHDLMIPNVFRAVALSFELRAMKPEPEIFREAAALAHAPPEDLFYVDDIAGHVAAAREAGFQAVQYTTTKQLVTDMRAHGILFNY